ncbi:MAG: hypothetical protein KIT58_15880 [Planctomycetota bacterium]|nr:hypothetical protein [Planctomycetota bacterium]
MRLLLVLIVLLGGCHRLHLAVIDLPAGPGCLAEALEAAKAIAAAHGLEPVPPQQDLTAGDWWEPQLVCAFVGPGWGSFGLVLWIELDPLGPVVWLQQYWPGWGAAPQFQAVLADVAARLPGRRVREGRDAWAWRARGR